MYLVSHGRFVSGGHPRQKGTLLNFSPKKTLTFASLKHASGLFSFTFTSYEFKVKGVIFDRLSIV